MEKTIIKKLAKQLIALLLVFNMMLSVIAPAISFAQANEAEDNRILSVVDEKGEEFKEKVKILFKDVKANKDYSVTTENGKIDLSKLPKNTLLNVQFEDKGDFKKYDLLDFEGKYSYIYNDSHLVVDNGSSDKSEKKLDKIRIKKVSPMEVKVLDEQGYLITEPIKFLLTDKFNGTSPVLTSKDGYLDFSGIKIKDPTNFFQAKVSFPDDNKLKLKYASENQDEMDIAFNKENTEVQVIQEEGYMYRGNHSIIIEGYKRTEKNPEETEIPAEKNTDYQLEILDSKTKKKITEEIEFKFVDTFDEDEEYPQNIKSKDGILDLSQIEDKDTTYKVSIVNNDKYKITNLLSAKGKPATLKFNGKEIQATAGDGNPAVLKSLVLENTKPEDKKENEEYATISAIIMDNNAPYFGDTLTFIVKDNKTGEVFTTKSNESSMFEIKLKKGHSYTISLENNSTKTMQPVKFTTGTDELGTPIIEGTQEIFGAVELKDKKTEEPKPEEKELKDKEVTTIQDIKVEYEDGEPVEDNLHFHTFNKENKDMQDYYTKDGYLKGVKAPVGSRMKLGLAELTEFLTLTNGKVPHKYFNYIWFKTDNKSVAKSYDIQTKQTGKKIEKIIVVQRQSLIGNEPKNKERANISIDVYDTTAKRKLNEKSVLFSLVGAHQEETVEAKDGRLDLDLYKDTMYTIKLDASIQHPYKSDGIRIQTKDGKTLLDEQGNKLDKINVFQGSYLSRIYVIHGQKHVNKDIKFRIEEVGNPNNVQIRSKEGLFLNMDVMMDKTYKISMEGKDDEYFMEKPIEFKLAKSSDDGLYWPMVDDKYPEQGKDHKLKAVFLKRYDGKDNELPGLDDNTDCPTCPGKPEAEEEPQSSCNVSTVKIKTKPINVELPEGADKNDLVFKLFNSSKQRYEGEFKLNENNQLQALDLYEHNSYFIQLISKDYKMFNQYIQAYKNNEYAYNFKKNMLQDKLVVTKKTPFEGLKTDVERMLALLTNGTDGKHQFNLRLINKGQIVPNTKISFSSEFDTFEVTSDDKGVIKVRLYEDVTYNLRSLDDKYVIDTFPLVVKDKTEWGTEGTKLLFDHSSCNGIQDIKLIDAKQGKVNGQVTCKPGNTTITGADFKQLSLLAYHLDNNNYPMLKGKEAMVLDLVLINSMRQNCEKSKFADGDFTILRKLPTGKEVADVYFINKDNTKEKLTFEQKDNIVKITGVHSLGIKPLAIEYKSNAVEFPEEKATSLEKLIIKVLMNNKPVKDFKLRLFKMDLVPNIVLQPTTNEKGEVEFSKLDPNSEYEIRISVNDKKSKFNTDSFKFSTDKDGKINKIDGEKVEGQKERTLIFEGTGAQDDKFKTYEVKFKVTDKDGKPVEDVLLTANRIAPRLSTYKQAKSDKNGDVIFNLEGEKNKKQYVITLAKNAQFMWKSNPDSIALTVDENGKVEIDGNSNVLVVEKHDQTQLLEDFKTTYQKATDYLKNNKFYDSKEAKEKIKDLQDVIEASRIELENETIPEYAKGKIKQLNDAIDALKKFEKKTSKPNNPVTPTPSVPGIPTPSVPGTPTPSNPGTVTPSNPGTVTPSVPGTTTPSVPGTTTPSVPGTVTPSVPGTTTPEKPAETTKATTRVAGTDRINTAVEVSKKYYKSAETVIIANYEKFADSLSASALSKALKAPILLVKKDQLDSVVAQEIKRLGAKNVVVIGGEQSVDEAKNSLSKYNVQTIAGSDRYETSAKIAQEIIKRTGTTQAVIASGETFADALTVAPLANKNNMPILLVQPNNIPKATQEVLKQIKNTIIVGGEKTISNQVANKLPNPTRIAGANRYETAKKIYEYGFKDRKEVNIANGTNFADSLVIGSIDCPILLAESNEVPESTKQAIKDSKFEKVNVFGGENSIDESVVKELIK
ncbi:cell wall-binding repeat-containing protein [Finegoldia magna]|uniref:Putative cell wall binding repeat 2 n=1 Tax=Finegoldia magna BVS033A4 TaxID=866773 RepID=E1KXK9_FINMA|nr:cell wall-binding repeat-containing protein [Finegoldia magna]EFL54189.1 putative cell wall binding repeat 2 [Finegoldia magna BVS033A4]